MAQAFAERMVVASSAGTVPARQINPIVVEVMKEKGADITSSIPKMLTPEMINQAALVITMGCSVADLPKAHASSNAEKIDPLGF